MKWQIVEIGNREAIAPVVISASRATDIPAFYTDWFFNRLNQGYLEWINPFNGQKTLVSLAHARAFIFWSKNPEPMLSKLTILDKKRVGYYFQFTLNDYQKSLIEPNLPSLRDRINTFIKLSQIIGKERVIWRFDPIWLPSENSIYELLERIRILVEQLHPYTNKLVISFAEIERYRKVKLRMKNLSIPWFEPNLELKQYMVQQIADICRQHALILAACAQAEDYSLQGAIANKCIDDELLKSLYGKDDDLLKFLNQENTKDSGQRKHCNCIKSKDIGMYNTCKHLCRYCYANVSDSQVLLNSSKHCVHSIGLIQR